MEEIEKLIKTIKDDKTDVNLTGQVTMENARNSVLGSKIKILLDMKLTCKESCCISHSKVCSKDLREIVYEKYNLQSKDLYPEQYPEPYPEAKLIEYVDVLYRSWDTGQKHLEEFSEYNYVFPGWWESLLSQLYLSRAAGSSCSHLQVPRDRARSRSS